MGIPLSSSDVNPSANPERPAFDVYPSSPDGESAGADLLEKILTESVFQRKLAHFICVYSLEVSAWEPGVSDPPYGEYFERLKSCVRFHAEQLRELLSQQSASPDLTREQKQRTFERLTFDANPPVLSQAAFAPEVLTLASIETTLASLPERYTLVARKPSNKDDAAVERKSLGGDPMRDCVLASSLLSRADGAVEFFQKEYFSYLQGIAFKVHAHFGNDPDQWWNEFLDHLAGYTRDRGKLLTFQGKCALQYWLRVVVWNFLRRRPIYSNGFEFPEEIAMMESNEDDVSRGESLKKFTDLVRKALEALTDKDRLLLSLIYIESMLKKDIAAMFQVHAGQIGRWEERALQGLRKAIALELENQPRKATYDDIFADMAESPREFSEALMAALQPLRNEDAE